MTKEERIKAYNEFMPESAKIPVLVLETIGFFDVPASVRYHGAYTGGLFDHSLEVAKQLVNLTEKLELEWKNPNSPFIVGMFHDFCKLDNYVENSEYYNEWDYNSEIIIPGHGDKSVIMLQKYFELNDEEIACIRWHMGAYEKDPKMWEYYGRAIEKYPNVLYTHTADMIASKIVGI